MSVSNSIIRSGLSVSDLKGVPWCLENSLLTFKFCGFQNSFYTLLWGNTGFQTRCMCWILLSKKYIQLQSTSTAPVRLLPACDDHSWEVIQWIQIYSSFWAGFAWDDPAGWQTLSIPVWEARTAQWHQPASTSQQGHGPACAGMERMEGQVLPRPSPDLPQGSLSHGSSMGDAVLSACLTLASCNLFKWSLYL